MRRNVAASGDVRFHLLAKIFENLRFILHMVYDSKRSDVVKKWCLR
jgi:hypothetical protein